jgi:hypothetical protein
MLTLALCIASAIIGATLAAFILAACALAKSNED